MCFDHLKRNILKSCQNEDLVRISKNNNSIALLNFNLHIQHLSTK